MAHREHELLVERLLDSVPRLKSVYDKHLADYDELLPHVFFGDLTRYVTGCFADVADDVKSTGRGGDALRILKILDDAFNTMGPAVQELISVSFLENVDWEEAGGRAVSSVMGPALRKEKARRDETWPRS